MLFKVKEEEVFVLIEQFLKCKALYGTLRSLEKETSVVLGNLTEVTILVARKSLLMQFPFYFLDTTQ